MSLLLERQTRLSSAIGFATPVAVTAEFLSDIIRAYLPALSV